MVCSSYHKIVGWFTIYLLELCCDQMKTNHFRRFFSGGDSGDDIVIWACPMGNISNIDFLMAFLN